MTSPTEPATASRFLGVDLAWREGGDGRAVNESGVAAIDAAGRVLDAGWTRGLDETIDWINTAAYVEPALLFIDAPLVVTNATGQRLCEREAGQRYGRWKVSANSTNLNSRRLAGVTLRRRLQAGGWTYSDGSDWPPTAPRTMCECYPYTTLVGAAELGYSTERPRYKRQPKRMPVAVWRPQRAATCDDLIRRLATLANADPPLRLDSHPATRALCQQPSPLTEAEYKHREDLIDALICAWTAALWSRHGLDRCQILGLQAKPDRAQAATVIAPARREQRRQSETAVKRSSTMPGDTRILKRGREFHQRVQTAFIADLLGADAAPERTITLITTRKGRLDLLVLPQGDERMAVIVEIKSTRWDELAEHRVRPNLRDHIRQLQGYLDVYVSGLEGQPPAATTDEPDVGRAPGPTWDSVVGVLLYPQRPADPGRAQLIEEAAELEALTVVWFNETDWQK